MRASPFSMLVSLVTLMCAIITSQSWTTAQSERDPQNPAEYWLLLSTEAKREYVHGYLHGFWEGKRSACYFYAEKITPYLPHESVPVEKLPESVCLHSLPEFAESQHYDVYVDTITRYFKKYPRDRQGAVSQVLEQMAAPPGIMDIDALHAKLGPGGK